MGSGRASIDQLLRDHRLTSGAGREIEFNDVAPLATVIAHRHPDGHHHYVTIGLTELGHKVSDLEASGWGFELTMRAPPTATGDPPRWPVRALRELASHVVEARSPLASGHHLDLGGPLDSDAAAFTALAVTTDPELGTARLSTGIMTFLQVVGLHADEEALVTGWSVPAFLAALGQQDPLLLTRPDRSSLLADPSTKSTLESRARDEGPRSLVAIAESLRWRRHGWLRRSLSIELAPAAVARRNLLRMLPELGRHDHRIRLMASGRALVLRPGPTAGWRETSGFVELALPPAAVDELGRFLEGGGAHFSSPLLPGLELRLVD
jgi:suppressor of fused-like protein